MIRDVPEETIQGKTVEICQMSMGDLTMIFTDGSVYRHKVDADRFSEYFEEITPAPSSGLKLDNEKE